MTFKRFTVKISDLNVASQSFQVLSLNRYIEGFANYHKTNIELIRKVPKMSENSITLYYEFKIWNNLCEKSKTYSHKSYLF